MVHYGPSNGSHFSFKYFLKYAFIREKSLNCSSSFGHYRHKWVNPFMLSTAKISKTTTQVKIDGSKRATHFGLRTRCNGPVTGSL